MKLNIHIFLLFILSCATIYAQDNDGTVYPATDTPHLRVSEQTWDFGKIDQGEQVEHEFTLRNVGKQELIIKKIKSTCGCTVAQVTKRTLQPNETAQLIAKFNSLGRRGRQLKKIYITTNDPLKHLTTLVVKGLVKRVPGSRINVVPKKWDFGLVEPGTAPQRTFIIKNNGVKDLVVSHIDTSTGCHAEMPSEKIIPPGKETILNVNLDKLNMAGLIEDFIKISSNDTSNPTQHIRIYGYVKGEKPQDLRILSDRIDLGVIDFSDKTESPHFEITLYNAGDAPLTIKKIQSPRKFIPTPAPPFQIDSQQNKSVRFEIKDDNHSGTFKDIIIIHSDDSKLSRSKITLFGYVIR